LSPPVIVRRPNGCVRRQIGYQGPKPSATVELNLLAEVQLIKTLKVRLQQVPSFF
jgi:hypothetical protein